MNDKDKEAFDKWWQNMYDSYVEFRDWQGCDIAFDKKEDMRIGWQAACAYQQKEVTLLENEISYLEETIADFMDEPDIAIKRLQAENAKLRELVKDLADNGMDYDIASRIEELDKE